MVVVVLVVVVVATVVDVVVVGALVVVVDGGGHVQSSLHGPVGHVTVASHCSSRPSKTPSWQLEMTAVNVRFTCGFLALNTPRIVVHVGSIFTTSCAELERFWHFFHVTRSVVPDRLAVGRFGRIAGQPLSTATSAP